MGARFAKWRAVIAIGDSIPSRSCIEANAHALARYAALCQEAGLVPVVEPEVLMDGDHTLERCRAVTEEVLRTVFNQLNSQRVLLEGMILKPNMVLPGFTCPPHQEVEEAAIGEQQFQVRLTDRQPDEVEAGRGGQHHGEESMANCPRSGSGDCVFVRRPIRRTGLGPFECHESSIRVATALGAGVFVCPRHPATGLGNLSGQGGQRESGTAGVAASGQMQPRRPPWRIHCRDGKDMRVEQKQTNQCSICPSTRPINIPRSITTRIVYATKE